MNSNKRKEKDVMKLLTGEYDIDILNDTMSEFTVVMDGPADSPYEGVSEGGFEKSEGGIREFINKLDHVFGRKEIDLARNN